MPDRLTHGDTDYDAQYRCRYCGAPCNGGGVCYAHTDIHMRDVEGVDEAAQRLTFGPDAWEDRGRA